MLNTIALPANNALERTVNCGGRIVLAMDCVLADAQWRSWSATQVGRQASRNHRRKMAIAINFEIECEREDDGRWLAEVPQLPGVRTPGHHL